MSHLGASGEDVDLWLDTELFMDVQLPSGEWVEGESVEVRGRWILVRFFARADLDAQWINVDTDTARLAELHTRSGAEAQRAEAEAVAGRLDLNDAAAAAGACGSVAAAAGVAAAPAAAAGAGLSARQQFESQVARDSYCEVLQRNRSQMQRMIDADGEMWLQRLAEKRFHAQNAESKGAGSAASAALPRAPSAAAAAAAASSSSALLSKSMSCFTPSSSAAAAAASSASSLDDDVSLAVSAVSIKLPLFDSLTRHRLVVPVRSSTCTHHESFDLWTHVQHRIEQSDSNPLWLCPICKREAFADDLLVDPLLFHVLRCVEDGRLDEHVKAAAREAANGNGNGVGGGGASRAQLASSSTLTPASELMSASALRRSLAALDSLLEHPPMYGSPSSCCFEERRLTIATSGGGGAASGAPSLRLTVATESDESARIEARRHMQRRARTMPTPSLPRSADKRKSALLDEHEPGSSGNSNGGVGPSPLKRQRLLDEDDDYLDDDDMADAPPASSSAAAAAAAIAAAASSSSAAAAAAPSAAAASACPWPSWVDADGLVWVDVRGDPADCEPADRWANIRVKMEKQHAAYQAIQKQKEALMAAPPLPPPPPPMPPPPMAAPANVQAMQLSPAQLAVFMQAQGLGHLTPASALPPSFPRASTLPSPAIPSSRSPARAKKAKKMKRADSAAVASAGAASASSSSAAAAASSASSPAAASASAGPLLNLNTCSVWELQQLDGVGPKLANRIVTAREHKWLMKKVRFNDNIIDQRKEQQQQAQSPAVAAQPPQSLCECITPERCSHVRAFKSVKSLSKVDGLGTRMMQKLQALLTV